MTVSDRFRTGLKPLGLCLAALAMSALVCMGVAPRLGNVAGARQAFAALVVACHGGKPAAPMPAHPAQAAWVCPPSLGLALPGVPAGGVGLQAPRGAVLLAGPPPGFSPAPARVPGAALPRGPPVQAWA